MSESVPVRCPACRRAHHYTAPSYPCVCGAPVAPLIDRDGTPTPMAHPVWQEQWVTLRCRSCGRRGEWPRPELGCPCGTVLRIPVAGTDAAPAATAGPAGPPAAAGSARQPFRPVAIRTAQDAVRAAALHLRRLGYQNVRRAGRRPPSGIGLAARGALAQVDPTVRPASVRDVECLWLTAMTESADCLYFSLTGYADDARVRADALGIPLFVLGPAGTPRPVNGAARDLESGAG